MSVTSVRLQPDVEDSLDALAEKLQRSKNWLVNQAIKEFAARTSQEQSRWSDTIVAMEAVARGEVVSGEAVHAWLASWGQVDELPAPKPGK